MEKRELTVIEQMVSAFERDLEERQGFAPTEMPDTPYTVAAMTASVCALRAQAGKVDGLQGEYVRAWLDAVINESPSHTESRSETA